MKKFTVLLLGGLMILSVSCKKGECTCEVFGQEVTTEYEADDREDYKDAKNDCEDAGCDWSAKL